MEVSDAKKLEVFSTHNLIMFSISNQRANPSQDTYSYWEKADQYNNYDFGQHSKTKPDYK